MPNYVYTLGVLGLLYYFAVPLLIKAKMRINARPGMNPVTPGNLPDDAQEYFNAVGGQFSTLGFEQAACFIVENSVPGVTPYVQLWINRKTGQAASANFIIARSGDRPPTIRRHVEFVTRIAEGIAIQTNNSQTLGAFKKTSAADTLSAARLCDPARLYLLHCWRERELAGALAQRYLPRPGGEMQWFADAYEESIARQVGTGYLQRDASDPTLYTPSTIGAYAMTWAQQFPMKQMRRSAEDRRAESQMRQAVAARPISTPSSVRITHQPPTRQAA